MDGTLLTEDYDRVSPDNSSTHVGVLISVQNCDWHWSPRLIILFFLIGGR